MKRLCLVLLVSALLVSPAYALNFPDTPILNQEVTGPNGQVYRWDGTKWVHAPASGNWNLTTLNLTGPAPALTFNGVPLGASCPAGEFVRSISNAGVPACEPINGGTFP